MLDIILHLPKCVLRAWILRLSRFEKGYEVESKLENHISVLKALGAIAGKTVVYIGLNSQFLMLNAERLYYGPILDQWDERV